MTGFYRDGCCTTGPEDVGSHTICAVVTAEFLAHQRSIGNDLSTPRPEYRFPGLQPGDRWCVTAVNWLARLPRRLRRAGGAGQHPSAGAGDRAVGGAAGTRRRRARRPARAAIAPLAHGSVRPPRCSP
ncbi:hypothetical protein C731_0939 [Mycolicibacterium hassiacum DSM 44199]|uniref:DUF2237 domain-containing protein n=1 Tax=Mycolicibacterium hassiacum (strain DSM 44199 / CIP 105218 / JCM 12690 / 3849) TaxID=1122247 RepID=K5BGS2_MYCHD|nr:hypothetical protein C731_0939 [Mycolicibacterium hassiacum DSM 44199]